MTTAAFTPARLFRGLPQKNFEGYNSFERAFVQAFNAHRFDFPAGYGWRDALDWGVRRDVVRRDGRRVVIDLKDINI